MIFYLLTIASFRIGVPSILFYVTMQCQIKLGFFFNSCRFLGIFKLVSKFYFASFSLIKYEIKGIENSVLNIFLPLRLSLLFYVFHLYLVSTCHFSGSIFSSLYFFTIGSMLLRI